MIECLLSMHQALGEVPRGHSQGLGTWGVQGIELQDCFLYGREGRVKISKRSLIVIGPHPWHLVGPGPRQNPGEVQAHTSSSSERGNSMVQVSHTGLVERDTWLH